MSCPERATKSAACADGFPAWGCGAVCLEASSQAGETLARRQGRSRMTSTRPTARGGCSSRPAQHSRGKGAAARFRPRRPGTVPNEAPSPAAMRAGAVRDAAHTTPHPIPPFRGGAPHRVRRPWGSENAILRCVTAMVLGTVRATAKLPSRGVPWGPLRGPSTADAPPGVEGGCRVGCSSSGSRGRPAPSRQGAPIRPGH